LFTQKAGHATNYDILAVYLPPSCNFSGNLFLVPASNVEPLLAKASEVMKFIASGDVTNV